MLDILIHVWSKQNQIAIACLGLAPLVISCAATDIIEPPSDTAASRASEETLATGEPIAPQPEQALAEAAAPANSNLGLQVQSVIPMQFRGEWNMALEGCGVLASDGRLQIELNRINFYESFGNVQEVIVQGDLKMTVTAEYAGEGEIFTRTDSFELSSDRSTLTRIGENDFSVRYRRCSN